MSGLGRLATLPGLPKGLVRELYARVPEREFQQQIEQVADRLGHLLFHDPDGRYCKTCGTFQKDTRRRGLPDLIIPAAPVLVFAELKTMGGATSPEQKRWIGELNECRYLLTDVWRPDQSQTIAEFLADPEAWVRRLRTEGVSE